MPILEKRMRDFKLKIPIFKPGKWQSMQGATREYTAGELQDIANVYNQGAYQAKLFITHEQSELPVAPSGVITRLAYDGRNGLLYAELADVNAQAYDMLRNNAEVSASFFLPNHPNSPTPGQLFLNHVAIVPQGAVKGLHNEAGFADVICNCDNCIDETETKEEPIMGKSNGEQTETKDYEAEIQALKAQNEAMQKQNLQYATRMISNEKASFADSLAKTNKCNPDQAGKLADIYGDMLAMEYGLVSYGELQDRMSDKFRQALDALPSVVVTEELTANHGESKEYADPFLQVFEGGVK
jgi:hypothetical protein